MFSESEFASNLFDKQKAALREREEMKRLVLSQEQRQEEEELLVCIMGTVYFMYYSLCIKCTNSMPKFKPEL